MLKLNNILVFLTVSFFVVTTTSLVGGAHGAVIFKNEVQSSNVSGVWFGCLKLDEDNWVQLTPLRKNHTRSVNFKTNENGNSDVNITCRFVQRKFREVLQEPFLPDSENGRLPQLSKTETSQRDQRFVFKVTEEQIRDNKTITIVVKDEDISISSEDSTPEVAKYTWGGPLGIDPPSLPSNRLAIAEGTKCLSGCENRTLYQNESRCWAERKRGRRTWLLYSKCTINESNDDYHVKDEAKNRILTIRGVPCATPCEKSNTSDIFSCQTRVGDERSYDHCSPNAGDDYKGRDCLTVWDEGKKKCTKPCGYIGDDLYKTCEVMAVRIARLTKTSSSCSYDEDEVHLPNNHVTCKTVKKAWDDLRALRLNEKEDE